MKIQTALSACIVLLLGGCASYSNSYREDLVYQRDGYYDAPDVVRPDDGYYGDTYYDSGYDDSYYGSAFYGGGSFGYGFGDPFFYGNRYRYCSPRYAICPGAPLAMFLLQIGGPYWLLFDGFGDRSYYYGGGYGWPYSNWWGYPHHHHHHHHHHDDPPDPVVVTPQPPNGWVPSSRDGRRFDSPPHPRKGVFTANGSTTPPSDTGVTNDEDVRARVPRERPDLGSNNPPPNGWAPSPRDGRRFDTPPHPRKGVFTANGSTAPRSDTSVSDDENFRARVPRARPDLGTDNQPPMRWRPPTLGHTAPVDRPLPVRNAPQPVRIPRQLPVAPSDRTRAYVSEPTRRSRPEPTEALAQPRPTSRPEPQPVHVPNQDSSDDRSGRGRRRGDGSGDG